MSSASVLWTIDKENYCTITDFKLITSITLFLSISLSPFSVPFLCSLPKGLFGTFRCFSPSPRVAMDILV